jgi:demethylmenaquinone methyltransferase/2-methoxy-6-polyprenyl-1,4-benzoquinol methylase
VAEGGIWREQITYYRRRAGEYDATSYGDLSAVSGRITAILDRVTPAGDILEIACGTGVWTAALALRARTLTALDSSPEAVGVARRRLAAGGSAPARFVLADVLDWRPPPGRFDTVFFAFWLSHVPAASFAPFWALVRRALRDGGRAVFVDEPAQPPVPPVPGAPQADPETYVGGSTEIVERRLSNGEPHRLVKVFRDPPTLVADLARLDWRADVTGDGPDWLVGTARPAT